MAFTKIRGNNITNYTIETEQLSNTATAAFAKTLAPKIQYANVASNTYTVLDDTAVNVGGGYIVITGSEFQTGASVLIDTTPASSVTYVSSTVLRAQIPAKSAASYNLYVVNPDGGVGIKVAGVTYSSEPTWVTTSPLPTGTSNVAFSNTFSATGATTYSNTTILPTGFNLLSNGYYYGNISVGVETTYSFDVRATDAELQDSDKTFSLTVQNRPTTPYSINYLISAGGGGGSYGSPGNFEGSGGGAGGLLTGTQTLTYGTSYTITVGAAGTGDPKGGPGIGGSGGPSSFGGNTAIGGGGGSSVSAGSPGGSGGGAWHGSGGVGTPGQGNSGGGDPQGIGGGGGGAGGSGTFRGSPSPNGPGVGGPGSTWPFTNSIYSVGGSTSGINSAPGGDGHGGGSPLNPSVNGANGKTNAGGGGGGGSSSPPTAGAAGGSGGSGVIILAIPTTNYSANYTGSNVNVTTPPAAPGRTVLTFNSSGTYTA